VFELIEKKLIKSYETNEDEAPDAKTSGGSWIRVQTFVLAPYRNCQLKAYKRKPPTHRRKDAMQSESSPAGVVSATGLDWSVVGLILTVMNTLMSTIMLSE